MKIKFDVECTPEEARALFGLPDVRPLQARFMAEAEERMRHAFDALDGEALLKMWLPAGAGAMEKMQQALWSAMGGGKDPRKKD